jgi:hypothetical protein
LSEVAAIVLPEGATMTVKAETWVVLSSRQLLVAQVAAALCSDAVEFDLGDWESRRVPLGEDFASLARRLAMVRDLDAAGGAEVVTSFDGAGESVLAAELALRRSEILALRVAAERMRGIVAGPEQTSGTGRLEEVIDDDLEQILGTLA